MQESTDSTTPTVLVQALQKEAKSNKAFEAVCTLFASRERARHQVTLQSLRYSMLKEGFHFDEETYAQILSFLAKAGVGKIVRNKKNQVTALVEVKYTLQTIGKAALSATDNVKSFTPDRKYSKIPVPTKAPTASKEHVMPTFNASIRTEDGRLSIPLSEDDFKTILTELFIKKALNKA
jgi:hypothetical protein